MFTDPGFPSPRARPDVGNAPAAERHALLDRSLPAEPDGADRATSFSRVAEAQRISSAALDQLLDQLPAGVMVVDRDGRVVYANRVARALKVERLEPLQWAVTRALLTEDAVREDEIEVAAPGQSRRLLSAHVMPVRVSGRGVTAAFVTLSDVTARERMRAWDPVIETLVNL